MNGSADIHYLQKRIQELEEKIEQLRLSRRVLMNLIEKIEKDKSGFVSRLEKENRKLHKDNYRYAQNLLQQNRRIVELQAKLETMLEDEAR
ncbi:translation initiation factor 2 [Desulforamulus aquiferis]|uniref:Translation initiation factor 2 n=1 Tax=Desulforamulus aquiferis TaxID=1397668 RepID=A0AAW7ZDC2_9FIRM|nr:translation initiation factor 2 [Desulforamulus aquiferis]MDO7787443.1 translation initiation factor 2 [Desulforamulus aquiferis]RYD05390.1 translation initiation factor 2 [Desulforamulus aquiferis]